MVSHAGYRGAERPVQVVSHGVRREIREIVQRWREPEHEYFRVRLDDDTLQVLRHTLDADDWELATSP